MNTPKISIIGGGIAGMSAYIFLKRNGFENVKIYSSDLGGEFLSGGFKYFPCTAATEDFVGNILGFNYGIGKINGAIYYEGSINEFPLFLCKDGNRDKGMSIQYDHWDKTRGYGKFTDRTCMNDPWSGRTELKIIPEGGLNNLFDIMITECKGGFTQISVDKSVLGVLMGESDIVIYTIPVSPLIDYYRLPSKQIPHSLVVLRSNPVDTSRMWYDYLYVPSKEFPFHRVSKRSDGGLDIEIMKRNYTSPMGIKKAVVDFVNRGMNITVSPYDIDGFYNPIKGHVVSVDDGIMKDVVDDKKILLLGRYAQQDSRITWDKVISRLYSDLSKRLSEFS